MFDDFSPIPRERLTDNLASRILELIRAGTFRDGDRLPPIARMAAVFQVGAPTVRQALTKLEMLGVVDVRHGLGVFIRDGSGRIQRLLIEHDVVTGD